MAVQSVMRAVQSAVGVVSALHAARAAAPPPAVAPPVTQTPLVQVKPDWMVPLGEQAPPTTGTVPVPELPIQIASVGLVGQVAMIWAHSGMVGVAWHTA